MTSDTGEQQPPDSSAPGLTDVNADDMHRLLELGAHYRRWRSLRASHPLTAPAPTIGEDDPQALLKAVSSFESRATRLAYLPETLRDSEIKRLATIFKMDVDEYLLVQEWWAQAGREWHRDRP